MEGVADSHAGGGEWQWGWGLRGGGGSRPPHDGRARPQHLREQDWPRRGHEVPRVHARAVRRHLPGGRDARASLRRQGSARC